MSVGEPFPVHTKPSSTSRSTRSGRACANAAARSAPPDCPNTIALARPVSRATIGQAASRSTTASAMSALLEVREDRPYPSWSIVHTSKPSFAKWSMTE
jgi:hypothetical protein